MSRVGALSTVQLSPAAHGPRVSAIGCLRGLVQSSSDGEVFWPCPHRCAALERRPRHAHAHDRVAQEVVIRPFHFEALQAAGLSAHVAQATAIAERAAAEAALERRLADMQAAWQGAALEMAPAATAGGGSTWLLGPCRTVETLLAAQRAAISALEGTEAAKCAFSAM